MQILLVDIGTGTQDIFLYDSRLDIENGFKLILPAPTMILHRQLKEATKKQTPVLLTGHQMGGGPMAWAAQAHARAGIPIFATPEAATSINDDLIQVSAVGIKIISEDEANKLPPATLRLELKDFDFEAIASVFAGFGISLHELSAVAVAVFDHGAAPAGVSDRQFRFDYLNAQIRKKNSLSSFAFLSGNIPASMSRLKAIAGSANELDCPLVVMDTAPAAVLGASLDPVVSRLARKMIVNVGNFHTVAFRIGPNGIEGLFEHHTGEIDLQKLESLLRALADGTLKHQDVFDDMGHGALIYNKEPLILGNGDFDVIVTGPRRSMFLGGQLSNSNLKPYFAVPFGDMMIAGCFGLLAAMAEVLPQLGDTIRASLRGISGHGIAPWDAD
jgi:uncharacterized protein (DUF1786 family)